MICALHYNHFAALLQLNVSCARRLAIQVTLVLIALACGALWWKYAFQLDKYAYNKIHPFTCEAYEQKGKRKTDTFSSAFCPTYGCFTKVLRAPVRLLDFA